MRRITLTLLAVCLVGFVVLGTRGQPPDSAAQSVPPCWDSGVPRGAIAPAQPIWCASARPQAPSTVREGPNAWVDDFNQTSNPTPSPTPTVSATPAPVCRAAYYRNGTPTAGRVLPCSEVE